MHMYIVSFALGDMNYLMKFVACGKLVDDLVPYFQPTGAINTIIKQSKEEKLFWLTKWLSKVLQIKNSNFSLTLTCKKRSEPPNSNGDFEDVQVTQKHAGNK